MDDEPAVLAAREANGRWSHAWRAATGWVGRHRLIALLAGIALVAVGVVLFRYGVATHEEGGCPPALPCTGPGETVSKGWQGAVIATLGVATVIIGALTALLSAVNKLVLASRSLWHDVRPKRRAAKTATKRRKVDDEGSSSQAGPDTPTRRRRR